MVLRGIPNAYAMRNGWIWYSPMDSYSTERVELLRGPNAFLYGEADVGGAQNQMTKRGLFTRDVNRLKVMFGSHELRRGEKQESEPIHLRSIRHAHPDTVCRYRRLPKDLQQDKR